MPPAPNAAQSSHDAGHLEGPGAAWSACDLDAFVEDTANHLHEAARRFFLNLTPADVEGDGSFDHIASMRPGPTAPGLKCLESSRNALRSVLAWPSLHGSGDPDEIRRWLQRYTLDGPLPDAPLPPDVGALLCLSIFVASFPALRRIAATYTDGKRRARLNAEDAAAHPREHRSHQDFFEALYDWDFRQYLFTVADILDLLCCARPVRSRLAGDAGFLDMLALGSLYSASVPAAYFRRLLDTMDSPVAGLPPDMFEPMPYPAVLARGIGNARRPLHFLARIVAEHPAAYRAHVAAQLSSGGFCPLLLAVNRLRTYAEDFGQFRDLSADDEGRPVDLGAEWDGLAADLAVVEAVLDREAGHAPRTPHRDVAGDISDRCDWCFAIETADDKLRRCGRCRFARYCSTECQRAAWDAEHRESCRVLSRGPF
ncbi:hypothetical protein DFJ74DRAFT_671334 [Hyaloraphidium curvatum]|nr:hypothetical protein DFJ74DRAFT_671334 [Hyaloraphidium curvatum]